MAAGEAPEETKVSDRGMVTIPADLRRHLDIEPGDKLRWNTDEEGNLSVEVVKQRYGAFEDDDMKAPMGGDSLETHDLTGNEEDPAFRGIPKWQLGFINRGLQDAPVRFARTSADHNTIEGLSI